MIDFCKRISASAVFHDLIIVVIILNAAILGLETSQRVMQSVGGGIQAANWAIQAIFVFEIAVRILAHWPRPLVFFRGGSNLFDFLVVAAAFLPVNGGFATIGRLLRLLRVNASTPDGITITCSRSSPAENAVALGGLPNAL